MADELQYWGDVTETGLTVVARVYDGTPTQVGSDVPCTEQTPDPAGVYVGDMPVAPSGRYIVRYFSGSDLLAQEELFWDGSVLVNLQTVQAALIAEVQQSELDVLSSLPSEPPGVAAIADAVWDEAVADHTAPGSTGEAVQTSGGGGSLTAQDVWEYDVSGIGTEGQAGKELLDAAATDEASASEIHAALDSYANKDDYKADVSALETEASASARATTLVAEHDATQAAISALPTPLTAAEVNAQVDAALADYDAPTKAELDATQATILSAISGGAPSAADIYAYFTDASRADAFKADLGSVATAAAITALQNSVDALNDLSAADVTAAVPNAAQIAVAVEAALINEGDGQQLIDAILQVFNANLDLPPLELTAIAQAMRAELAVELARIDVAVSSVASSGGLTPTEASQLYQIFQQLHLDGANCNTIAGDGSFIESEDGLIRIEKTPDGSGDYTVKRAP